MRALIGGLAATLLLVGPQSAAAATMATGSVTMVGETGDYVSQGQANLFDASTGSVALGGTLQHGTVAVSGGTAGASYSFDFAAPSGQVLKPGVYATAQRYPFQVAGRPGIDVSGDGRGCNQEAGTFLVMDVHADGSGNLDRLWVVYEDHCEGVGAPALFGEVRLGEPVPGAGASAEPAAIRWPDGDLGRPSRVVPVTVVAGSAGQQVDSVSLAETNPGDFTVRLDQCSGKTLTAGGRCQVFLRFTPATGGSRGADLLVRNSDGSVVDVPLSGFDYSGTSRMDLQSDPGDYIGGGAHSVYSTSNAKITASGSREHVTVRISGDDGSYMTADFSPGTGDILAAGSTYSPVARDAFRNGGAGLDVGGVGRGCNTVTGQFTVLDANFDATGNLLDFAASFIQHCDGVGPALRGTFEFRSPTAAPLLAVNNSPPTVTGVAQVGRILQSSPGSWNDTATAYGYQWQRCSAGVCGDIAGATGSSYDAQSADAGSQIALEVNLTNPAGQSAWVSTQETAVVLPPPPSNTSLPTVSGTATVGQMLTESHGSWTGSPSSFAYQWERCDSAGNACSPIAGATNWLYVPTASDVADTIRVQETASSAGGPGVPTTSSQTTVVLPLTVPNTTPTAISPAVTRPSDQLVPAITSTIMNVSPPPDAGRIKGLLLAEIIPTGKAFGVVALLASRGYTLSFDGLTAGSAQVAWYFLPAGARLARGKQKPLLVGRGRLALSAAGTGKLKLKLTTAGVRLLRRERGNRTRRVNLTAKAIFTPTGHAAVRATESFALAR